MVSIYKRKNENGTTVWRAVIRIKGYPTISKSFARKQEADDWEEEQRRHIRNGQFNFTAHNKHHTYVDLLHRMETDGAFTLQRSFKHCKSQYDYWRERLGVYGLTHITPEIIAQERKLLLDSSRSPATINRYTAVLASTLTYAVKKLPGSQKIPAAPFPSLRRTTLATASSTMTKSPASLPLASKANRPYSIRSSSSPLLPARVAEKFSNSNGATSTSIKASHSLQKRRMAVLGVSPSPTSS